MSNRFLKWISGNWYNEYIYFRFRIHKMPFILRSLMRLLLLPASAGIRLLDRARVRLIIPHVELPIMYPCNDACRDCTQIHPAHLSSSDIEMNRLIGDMEDFLFSIDRVYRLTILGSEPLLHRNLCGLLSDLVNRRKIDLLDIVTTGSITPAPDLLQQLQHPKIMLTVSNFPAKDSVHKHSFLSLIQKHHINFMERNLWRDLGSFNPLANKDELSLKNRFGQCIHKNFHCLSQGAYHLCPRSAHGELLGQFLSDATDHVVFRDRKNPRRVRKELKKLFRKKYLEACGQCRGSRRETRLTRFLNKLVGSGYHNNIYYKYRIFAMPLWKRDWAMLFFVPAALLLRIGQVFKVGVVIPHLEIPITTRCNFLCRDCANLISFYRQRQDEDVDLLIQDVKDFLCNVAGVHRFIVMGGETFLYRQLHALVDFLIRQRQICLVHLFTNGSIIPEPTLLKLLRHRKILVSISCFPTEVSPHRERLIEAFQQNKINYFLEDHLWGDLGGFNPLVDNCEEVLKNRFARCTRKICHNISRGEYHLCPRSVHGERLGQFLPVESDRIRYRNRKNPQEFKKELKRLLNKEYIKACTKCTGTLESTMMPGAQMTRGDQNDAV